MSNSPLEPSRILDVLLNQIPHSVPQSQQDEMGDDSVGLNDDLAKFTGKYILGGVVPKDTCQYPIQVVFHGCPGSGKSHAVKLWAKDVDKVIDIVFHPEMSYGDFVGVFRPCQIYRKTSDEFVTGSGQVFGLGEPHVTYQFVPGPFVEAYCFAKLNPEHTVVLILEELSRGNASLIFGDMLQLLDREEDGDAAGYSVYAVTPKPELREYLLANGVDDASEGRMRLPSNLYIWATMNRSDQNARQLDSAFLRRWEKRYLSHMVPCTYGKVLVSTPEGNLEWDALRGRINASLIDEAIAEDKLIGPYFLREAVLKSPERVAENLLGYVWNDVLRTRARDFFAPEIRSLADAINAWVTKDRNPFAKVSLQPS